jgi:hypothetical protein
VEGQNLPKDWVRKVPREDVRKGLEARQVYLIIFYRTQQEGGGSDRVLLTRGTKGKGPGCLELQPSRDFPNEDSLNQSPEQRMASPLCRTSDGISGSWQTPAISLGRGASLERTCECSLGPRS